MKKCPIQSCVLAPLLFTFYFSVMLETPFQNAKEGMRFDFRISDGLFTKQRFKIRIKTIVPTVRDHLFAGDREFLAHTFEDKQRIVNKFSLASNAFSLSISIQSGTCSTAYLYPPQLLLPPFLVEGKDLKTVSSFAYLDMNASNDAKTYKETECKIGKFTSTFGNLYNILWNTHDVSLKVKIDVYMSIVLISLIS